MRLTWEPEEMNSRRLTISCRYPEVRARRGEYVRSVPKPFLRLTGRWLDEAGFAIGAEVEVRVGRGRLVLQVVDAAHCERGNSTV
ncbi:SymE family type I addiction module toxin [Steroidobacter cummioxidans]|uniref:SymE family type I addiction module toxin n=1 Tax=Steroidobacter cummioxidans TaxID=1803913 RepID=UPI000E30F187